VLAAALGVAVVTGGASDIALYALPFLVLVALLLTGRFVGEERILAIRRGIRVGRARRGVRRWQAARPAHGRSLFARAPRSFRGPPAVIAV